MKHTLNSTPYSILQIRLNIEKNSVRGPYIVFPQLIKVQGQEAEILQDISTVSKTNKDPPKLWDKDPFFC